MTPLERIEHNLLAREDGAYRAMFIELCRRDVAFFISACCWTFDPRLKGKEGWIPFILYPKQEELVRWVVECVRAGQDWGIEKSRDTGVSWCVCAVMVWFWIFEPGFVGLLGSYKEEYIDKKGDPDSLFWKIDSLINSLESYMVPAGYTSSAPYRKANLCENPANGNVIKGSAPTENFGRSGRSTLAVMDELASWYYAQSAWTSVGENAQSRGAVSTPKGMNFFGRLMNPTKGAIEPVKRFRIHWTDDPRHNRTAIDPKTGNRIYPWYEDRKVKYNHDSTMIAQELDISYKGSVGRMVYPQVQFVRRAPQVYNPLRPTYVSMDYGVGDACAIGWFQWDYTDSRYHMLDYFQASGHGIAWYVPFLNGKIPGGADIEEYSPGEIEIIKRHRSWTVNEYYGDPSGRQRSTVSATSVEEELAKHGIYVITNTKAAVFPPRYEATKQLLMKLDVDEDYCFEFLLCLENSKFPERPEGSNSTTEIKLPVHDAYSHGRVMIEYLAVNEQHLSNPQRRVRYNRDVPAGEEGHMETHYDLDEYEDDDDAPMRGLSRAGY